MIRVQIPQVLSYDEDQVALIIEDPSLFSRQCPIILGTLTIFQVVQAMKESEMHNLELAWQYSQAGYEYTHFMMNPDNVLMGEGQSFPTNTRRNLLHIMIHAPYPEDKSSLPNGIYVLETYTELKDGSWNVSVVLQKHYQ